MPKLRHARPPRIPPRQGPGKVAIRPLFVRWPHVVARRHATALVQAGSQIPATGKFGHLVQTATLPGPWIPAHRAARVSR